MHTHTHKQVGVSINSDLTKLRRDWGLASQNSHDLGLAGGRVLHHHSFRQCSLASMARAVWGVEMAKSKREQLRSVGGLVCGLGQIHSGRNPQTSYPRKPKQHSNWEAPSLSEAQVRYAALDAIAGREIYLEMRRLGQLPPEEVLEGLMSRWLGSDNVAHRRLARSLAVERDRLRRVYESGTGQSCLDDRDPLVVAGGGRRVTQTRRRRGSSRPSPRRRERCRRCPGRRRGRRGAS